jgi:hypothetical protein
VGRGLFILALLHPLALAADAGILQIGGGHFSLEANRPRQG